jgi:hypothetical protein
LQKILPAFLAALLATTSTFAIAQTGGPDASGGSGREMPVPPSIMEPIPAEPGTLVGDDEDADRDADGSEDEDDDEDDGKDD